MLLAMSSASKASYESGLMCEVSCGMIASIGGLELELVNDAEALTERYLADPMPNCCSTSGIASYVARMDL